METAAGDGTVAALSQEQKVALATALVNRVALAVKPKITNASEW